MPLVTSRPPEKELDPVLMEVMIPAKVSVPDMEAVPPTSNMVSVKTPALIPNLAVAEVSSKLLATEAEPPNRVRPEILAVPPTSRLVSVAPPALIPNLLLPVISKFVETEAPPEKVVSPVYKDVPFTVKPVPTMAKAFKPLEISNDPANDDEPVPEKVALVAVRPFNALSEPEKELEAVPYERT